MHTKHIAIRNAAHGGGTHRRQLPTPARAALPLPQGPRATASVPITFSYRTAPMPARILRQPTRWQRFTRWLSALLGRWS